MSRRLLRKRRLGQLLYLDGCSAISILASAEVGDATHLAPEEQFDPVLSSSTPELSGERTNARPWNLVMSSQLFSPDLREHQHDVLL